MDKPTIVVDDPPAAFARFRQALQQIVSVSKEELKRREEAYRQRRKAKQHKAQL